MSVRPGPSLLVVRAQGRWTATPNGSGQPAALSCDELLELMAASEAAGSRAEELVVDSSPLGADAWTAPAPPFLVRVDAGRCFVEAPDGAIAPLDDIDIVLVDLIERPTTYLLGQVDTLPLGGFDSSATAMAQGPTRRARGEAYFKYLTEELGAKQRIYIVPECGHNDRCMYTTDAVFPFIFPK